MKDDSTEILFQSFLREAIMSSSSIGRAAHSLMLSIQNFPLLGMALPSLQSAVKDGFGEAEVGGRVHIVTVLHTVQDGSRTT